MVNIRRGGTDGDDLHRTPRVLVNGTGQPGMRVALWAELTHCFDDGEIVRLTLAVATINVGDRLAVSAHQALPDTRQNTEHAPTEWAHENG